MRTLSIAMSKMVHQKNKLKRKDFHKKIPTKSKRKNRKIRKNRKNKQQTFNPKLQRKITSKARLY
jgi:hypothetical protein